MGQTWVFGLQEAAFVHLVSDHVEAITRVVEARRLFMQGMRCRGLPDVKTFQEMTRQF